VRRKDGRFATGVIHLWHPDADRGELAVNDTRLQGALDAKRIRAVRGMSVLREGVSLPK
jgi:hypothetical protein